MSRTPSELGALRRRLRQERAELHHDGERDERDERDGDQDDPHDGGGPPGGTRAALVGLVIVAIAAIVAALSLPRIIGGSREQPFDPSNPAENLALCREYILTGPHASPGAEALVVDAEPGRPVRLPAGADCPLILEVRAPDGTFIQYVGSEETP